MKRLFTLLLVSALVCSTYAYDAVVDGIYYNLNTTDMTAEVAVSGTGYYAGAINIPSSISYQSQNYTVTAIARKAFYQNSTLTSVTLPETITMIGDGAFNECTALTSIDVPSGVDSIGNYVFTHSGITHKIIVGNMFAYMPETYTGAYAIPDTITRICGGAFAGCTNMTAVTLPAGLDFIGYAAFSQCLSISSVVIPNSITFLGEYAFNECFNLTSVVLPDNLSIIRYCTFYSCLSLSEIKIPATVQTVERFAFCYCPSLARVYCYPTNPPACGEYAFDQIAEEPILFVPDGSYWAYCIATEWKNFAPRIYVMAGDAVDDVINDGIDVIATCGHILIHGADGQSVSVYTADGKLVNTVPAASDVQTLEIPGSGIYFLRLSNGTTRRVVVK